MLQVKFTNRGGDSRDVTPTVTLKQLEPFIGKTKLKQGDTILLKVVNSEGQIGEFDFKVNRKDLKDAKALGWNSEVFGEPYVGDPITLGVCAVRVQSTRASAGNIKAAAPRAVVSTKATNASKSAFRRNLDKPTKRELQAALKANNGVKTATAEQFGVHPRSLGRWLESYGLA